MKNYLLCYLYSKKINILKNYNNYKNLFYKNNLNKKLIL